MRLVGPIFPQNSPNMNVSFTLYDSVLCSLMLKCQVCLAHTHKENFHSFFSIIPDTFKPIFLCFLYDRLFLFITASQKTVI